LTTLVAQRVQSLLDRRGLVSEPDAHDPLSNDDPGMAALLASSVNRRIAVGSNAGRGVIRLGDQIDGDSLDAFESPRCAMVSGFSVHANVCIEARDRMRLEELQPDYNQVGADRVAFNDDCACGASVARRRGRGAAELR
jgi:hypothetical protein